VLWRGGAAPIVMLRGGITTASPLPQQAFRIGGSGTVRGFDYGTRRGQTFWAVQVDWPLKRGLLQPVLFGDAGQAGSARQLFRSRAIAGGGAGLALLGGLLRFDLSHPITKGGSGLRFDLVARGFF
jgi:hemolysin activation/secretion protein